MLFDEYQDQWKQTFLDQGHTFVRDEPDSELDGTGGPPIDWFAFSMGLHNGPKCATCGWSCCWHCTKVKDIPSCTSKEPTND